MCDDEIGRKILRKRVSINGTIITITEARNSADHAGQARNTENTRGGGAVHQRGAAINRDREINPGGPARHQTVNQTAQPSQAGRGGRGGRDEVHPTIHQRGAAVNGNREINIGGPARHQTVQAGQEGGRGRGGKARGGQAHPTTNNQGGDTEFGNREDPARGTAAHHTFNQPAQRGGKAGRGGKGGEGGRGGKGGNYKKGGGKGNNQYKITNKNKYHKKFDSSTWNYVRSYVTNHTAKIDQQKREYCNIKNAPMIFHFQLAYIDDTIKELELQLKQFCAKIDSCKQNKHQMKRECFRLAPFNWVGNVKVPSEPLPALAKREEIEKAISKSPIVIIQGETGSGKSTQIAQYCADLFPDKKILCTQPRKLAATALAERVGTEFSPLFSKNNERKKFKSPFVGYDVGGHCQAGSRITYATEQKLLEKIIKLANKADLSGEYQVIIIDEAHERNILTDILIGLLKTIVGLLPSGNKDFPLRLIVTSATINIEKFKNYFTTPPSFSLQNQRITTQKTVPVVQIPGRTFKIHTKRRPILSKKVKHVNAAVSLAVEIHQKDSSFAKGDILVFLTAQDEVEAANRECAKILKAKKCWGAKVFSLYGKQTPEEQRKVFEPILGPKRTRKIIFATNVAETSLTINGVSCVIDCGLEKEAYFDHQRNMKVLRVKQISKSSAIQRAGRAGRTAEGYCYTLYSEEEFQQMEQNQTPEILKSSLGLVMLYLYSLNIDIENFDWIDAPSRDDILLTKQQLKYLQAIQQTGPNSYSLTPFGKFVVDLQVDPAVGKLMYEAKAKKLEVAAIVLASVLSSGLWWRGGSDENKKECDKKKNQLLTKMGMDASKWGDIVADYRVFEKWFCLEDWWEAEKDGLPAVSESETEDNDLFLAEPNSEDDDYAQMEQELKQLTTGMLSIDEFLAGLDEDDGDDETLTEKNSLFDDSTTKSESDAGSTTSEAQKKMGKVQREKNQRLWCTDYSLNSKSLNTVLSTAKDWAKIIGVPITKEGIKKVTNEQIQKLLFSAFFLNFCEKHQIQNHYCCLVQGIQAYIHPGSSLSNKSTSEAPAHKYVIYQELLHTSKSYLTRITPVSESWLQELLPGNILAEFTQEIQKNRKESRVFHTPRSILNKISGKHHGNIPGLEKQMKSVLEFDGDAHTLTVWTTADNILFAERFVQQLIENAKQQLSKEVYETSMAGSTRAIFGRGAQLEQVLLNEEFLQVVFTKLPKHVDDAALLKHIKYELKTNVALETMIYQIEINPPSVGSDYADGRIIFKDKKLAKLVQERVNNSLMDNQEILCSKCLSSTPGSTQVDECVFVLKWPIGAPNGKAYVTFATAEDANRVLEEWELSPDIKARGWKVEFPKMPKAPHRVELDGRKHYLLPPPVIERPTVKNDSRNKKGNKQEAREARDADNKRENNENSQLQKKGNKPKKQNANSDPQNANQNTKDKTKKRNNQKNKANAQNNEENTAPGQNNTQKQQKGKKEQIKESRDYQIQVTFNTASNIPTEIEIENIFSRFGALTRCQMKRFTQPKAGTEGSRNLSKYYDPDLEENLVMLRSTAFTSHSEDTTDRFPNSFDCLSSMSAIYPNVQSALNAVVDVNTSPLRFFHQKPQAELKYSTFITFNHQLYKAMMADFITFIKYAKGRGIEVRTHPKQEQITLQVIAIIHGSTKKENEKQLDLQKTVVQLFKTLLTPKSYKHPRSNELFTSHGSQKLVSLQRNRECCYIHWNKRDKSVNFYGTQKKIEVTKQELDNYLDTIAQSLQITRYYPANKANLVRKSMGYFKRLNNAIVLAQAKPLEKAVVFYLSPGQSALPFDESKFGFAASPYKNESTSAFGDNMCPICFCDDDEDSAVVLHCGHRYHEECFNAKMNPEDASILRFPLCCDSCQVPMIWHDICSFLSDEEINKLIRTSFKRYVASNSDKYLECKGVDCNQIFYTNQTENYCDACDVLYCGVASCREPVHPGRRCGEPEKIDFAALGIHPCPSCGENVQKGEGCFHISCRCGAHFCWGCLALKSGSRSGCSCGNQWGTNIDCNFIYHHMGVCHRPVNK